MVRQHPDRIADTKSRKIDAAAVAFRDNPMLLIGGNDDQIINRRSVNVADDAIALIYAMTGGASITG